MGGESRTSWTRRLALARRARDTRGRARPHAFCRNDELSHTMIERTNSESFPQSDTAVRFPAPRLRVAEPRDAPTLGADPEGSYRLGWHMRDGSNQLCLIHHSVTRRHDQTRWASTKVPAVIFFFLNLVVSPKTLTIAHSKWLTEWFQCHWWLKWSNTFKVMMIWRENKKKIGTRHILRITIYQNTAFQNGNV